MKDSPTPERPETSQNRTTLLHRSLAWLRTGRPDLAVQLLRRLAVASPGNPAVTQYLASACLRNGEPSEALAGFDWLLRADPDNAQALQGRGLALYRLGDRSGALDAFKRAIAADPMAWHAWRSIADITPYEDDRVHAIEGAADALLVACQQGPKPPLRAVAEALLSARQSGRARRLIESHAAGSGADPALLRLLARCLYHQGRFEHAFAQATGLLAAPPGDRPPQAARFEPGRATEVLIEIQAILSAAGVQSFLAAGTLLGFHRGGGPLPHDRDLDIGVLREADGTPDIAGILRTHPGILLPAISRPGDRYFGLTHRGVAVDIFLFDKTGRHRLCGFSHMAGDIQWRFTDFSLRRASYGGHDWTIPAAPERYLVESYGQDWPIPDPGFASAITSPALHETSPFARAYYAVIRADRARAAGDMRKAEALLRQSPIPVPLPRLVDRTNHPCPDTRPSD